MTQNKLIFSLFASIFISGILSIYSNSYAEESTDQTFVVSAYYSPLPNQDAYVRGSYEAEKRLQGEGTHGANGTAVYKGMLAAPRTYAFGTKIYIPGLGTGTIHDRGGAIRAYDGFDRIDVWMGYGDEGRKRALQWGMRKVQGKIMPSKTPENLNYSHIPSGEMYVFKGGNTSSVLSASPGGTLSIGNTGERVKSLQRILKTKGFFNGPITGKYGTQTKNAVFEFQKFYTIVKNKSDRGAGVYGPQTQKILRAHWNTKENISSEEEKLETKNTSLTLGDKGERVSTLQNFLKREGFFTGVATGNYGPRTQNAVFEFQKFHNIVHSKSDLGAGNYGPKTQKKVAALWENPEISQAVMVAKSGDEISEESAGTDTPKTQEKSTLTLGDKGERVTTLQNFLKKEGFFTGVATGNYGPRTQNAVFEFQKFHNIVHSKSDLGAGNYGPKTQEQVALLWENTSGKKTQTTQASEKKPLPKKFTMVPVGIGIGDKGIYVKRLQITLKTLGYFQEEPNGIFGPKTQQSVLAFQIDQKVLNKNTDRGAGYLGPRTHKVLSLQLASKRKNIHNTIEYQTKKVSAFELLSRRNQKRNKYQPDQQSLLSSL